MDNMKIMACPEREKGSVAGIACMQRWGERDRGVWQVKTMEEIGGPGIRTHKLCVDSITSLKQGDATISHLS